MTSSLLSKVRRFIPPRALSYISLSLPFRLLSRFNRDSQPICFSCELTTKCNIRCDFCTRTAYTEKGNKDDDFNVTDMADETLDRIIEELEIFHKAGRPVYFSPMGLGEPLLFSKLYETFERVKRISSKIPIVLVTNGVSLTKDHCEKIIHSDVDEVSISLNANQPSTYEQHMGLDKYETVCENIRTLMSTRNKQGRDNPRVYIQYIDYDDTRNGFSRDIREWAKIMTGQDKCYVHPIVNQGGFYESSNSRFGSSRHYPCSQPAWRMAIRVNGDLYPCDPAFYAGGKKIESLYLGNILSTSPFDLFTQQNGRRGEIMSCMRKDDYSQLQDCDKCNTYRLSPNSHFSLPFSIKLNEYKWF